MSKTTARELRRDALFDYLVSRPWGVTLDQIKSHLRTTTKNAESAVRDLRLWCDDTGDTINVICDNDGINPGNYRLAGGSDARPWQRQRLKSMESQLETMVAVSSSVARGVDGRTTEGRKARRIRDGAETILRDLNWIDEMTA